METSSVRQPGGWRVCLLLLLLVAFALRVSGLDKAPPGLYYDEAAHGLDALRLWAGEWHIFFPTANGHEPLFTYLVAGFVGVLGNHPLAVRLPAAMLGVLAVAAAFALGRRWFGPWPALVGAGLIAVTFWTVALSRIGYRANSLPLLLPLWLLSFWRCRRRTKLAPYVVMGLLLGLTQYTYTAARFIPVLAIFLAVDWWRLLDRRGLVVAAALAGLVTVPLAWAILQNLDTGTERIRDAWLFSRPEPWRLFWWQVRDHLGMFGWTGDPLWIHNLPFRPPVWWPVALLCLVGIALNWRQAAPRALFWTMVVLIWPGILAVSNNPAPPDQLRVLALATPVALLAAAGLWTMTAGRWRYALALGLALVLVDGGRSWLDYGRWSTARETYEQFDADLARIAHKVTASPTTFFLIPLSPDWHEFEAGRHWTIDYLSGWRPNYAAVGAPYTLPPIATAQVALVRWQAGMHLSADPQRTLAGALNLAGYTKVAEETENTFLLEHFTQSGQPVQRFQFVPDLRYAGGLQIPTVNLYVKAGAPGQPGQLIGEILWASQQAYPTPLAVSLRLQNAQGETVAQVDSALWNDLGETADRWRTGERSRLFLEAEATLPHPADYTVQLIAYDANSLQPLAPVGSPGDHIGSFTLRQE